MSLSPLFYFCFFFFNDTATTEIYTLSLHDALPISSASPWPSCPWPRACMRRCGATGWAARRWRSEEHTSELQSQSNLVCRLLLEKKKKKTKKTGINQNHQQNHLDINTSHQPSWHWS